MQLSHKLYITYSIIWLYSTYISMPQLSFLTQSMAVTWEGFISSGFEIHISDWNGNGSFLFKLIPRSNIQKSKPPSTGTGDTVPNATENPWGKRCEFDENGLSCVTVYNEGWNFDRIQLDFYIFLNVFVIFIINIFMIIICFLIKYYDYGLSECRVGPTL